jgi:hypothetical protein
MIARIVAIFFVLSLTMVTEQAARADAPRLSGHVSSNVEFGAAAIFNRDYYTGGMLDVTADLRDCFLKIGGGGGRITDTRASMCMLLDLMAYNIELGFRRELEGSGVPSMPPTTPFLADKAFNTRLGIYADLYFGGSMSNLDEYYDDALDQTLIYQQQLGN